MIKSVLLMVISYDFSTSSVKEENKKNEGKKEEREKTDGQEMAGCRSFTLFSSGFLWWYDVCVFGFVWYGLNNRDSKIPNK